MGGTRRWQLFFACAAACAQGSSDTARGSAEIGEGGSTSATDGTTADGTMSASSTTATTSPMNCVPGMQIACPCPGGTDGAQACLPDGSGYAPCECPTGDSSEVGTMTADATTVNDSASSGESGMGGCGGSCDSCTICAVQGACLMEYDSCNADDGCKTIIDCAIACGLTDMCAVQCEKMTMASMKSLALFEQLRTCIAQVCAMCM